MAMNPVSRDYPSNATGAQTPIGLDWRDAPNGVTYQIVFNSGASGSVTIDTTLDNVNDASITPVWTSSTAITSTTIGFLGSPFQFIRVTITSLSGGTLTFKVLEGAPDGGGDSGSGGGGGGGGGGGVSGSLVTGQYKVTASAAQIKPSGGALVNGVVITAKIGNTGTVFLGGSGVTTTYDGTGNGFALAPGSSASFPVNNLNLIYAIGTANDVISWEGN